VYNVLQTAFGYEMVVFVNVGKDPRIHVVEGFRESPEDFLYSADFEALL